MTTYPELKAFDYTEDESAIVIRPFKNSFFDVRIYKPKNAVAPEPLWVAFDKFVTRDVATVKRYGAAIYAAAQLAERLTRER